MKQFEIHPKIEKAETLPSEFYNNKEVFEYFKEKVFTKFWHYACDVSVVKSPGQVYPFTLLENFLDEPLLFTRDYEDNIHCLSNVCTHRGNLVVDGPGTEKFLRCRYHGRRFHIDGKFHSMPEFEGCEGFPSERDNLSKVPFYIWENLMFASINPMQDFESFYAPMLEKISWMPFRSFMIDNASSLDYFVKANWVLYCENYLEGFHIPYVHGALNEAIDYGSYETILFPFGSLQIAHSKDSHSIFNLPKDSVDYGENISAYYFWFFPNMMFNFYPWGLSINVVKPISIDASKVSFITYIWDESKREVGAGAGLDRVEREDEAIVENVQKGMKSRFYEKGRFSPKREQGVHHFHRIIADIIK